MKKISQLFLFTALILSSLFANATGELGHHTNAAVPEIDGNLAIIGLGLLSGLVAIMAERRNK